MSRRKWMYASLLTLLLLVLFVGAGIAEEIFEPLAGKQSYWFPAPDSGWMEAADDSVVMKFDTRMVTQYHHHSDITMKMFEVSGPGEMPDNLSCAEGEYPAWLQTDSVESNYLGANVFASDWVFVCCSDEHDK